MVNCKICEKEFGEDRQLHAHLKAHKLRMAGYYQKHFPRKDLYTKEIIKFKNKNYYFSNDFNSRINMKKWLKDQPIEKAKEYTKKIPKICFDIFFITFQIFLVTDPVQKT